MNKIIDDPAYFFENISNTKFSFQDNDIDLPFVVDLLKNFSSDYPELISIKRTVQGYSAKIFYYNLLFYIPPHSDLIFINLQGKHRFHLPKPHTYIRMTLTLRIADNVKSFQLSGTITEIINTLKKDHLDDSTLLKNFSLLGNFLPNSYLFPSPSVCLNYQSYTLKNSIKYDALTDAVYNLFDNCSKSEYNSDLVSYLLTSPSLAYIYNHFYDELKEETVNLNKLNLYIDFIKQVNKAKVITALYFNKSYQVFHNKMINEYSWYDEDEFLYIKALKLLEKDQNFWIDLEAADVKYYEIYNENMNHPRYYSGSLMSTLTELGFTEHMTKVDPIKPKRFRKKKVIA